MKEKGWGGEIKNGRRDSEREGVGRRDSEREGLGRRDSERERGRR